VIRKIDNEEPQETYPVMPATTPEAVLTDRVR